MKFGLPTLIELKDVYECIALAVELGLDFVEINMSFPQYQRDSLDLDRVKGLLDESGVELTIHADESLNPFDFNKKVSECYFDVMRDTIYTAKRLGIRVINMHLLKGIYVTLPDRVVLLNDVYMDEYLNRVDDFVRMCEDEIGDSGIKIAIENVDSNGFTSSEILALDRFMASDVFGLTLDTGHDYVLSGIDRHIFEKFPHKLVHLHLHDAREKSAHLPLGVGKVDTGAAISLLKTGDTCLIEVKTVAGLRESIEYLKANNYLH